MEFKIEILDNKNKEEYDKFLPTCKYSMAQHTLEWCEVIKKTFKDEAIYLIAKSSNKIIGAFPLFIRKSEIGNVMSSIPGPGSYGGILIKDNFDKKKEVYALFFEQAKIIAEENNCLTLTIATPPFSTDIELYKELLQPDYIKENFFQFIDLRKKLEFSKSVRKNLKKKCLGLTIERSKEFIDDWYDIHKKRLNELKAAYFPKELFLNMNKYGSSIVDFFYVKKNNKIISGSPYLYYNNIVDVYIMCGDGDYIDSFPNGFLSEKTILEYKNKNFYYYNWQSSPSEESGTFEFKRRFGSKVLHHYYIIKLLKNSEEIRKIDLEKVKENFQWFYFAPYDLWEND